MPASCNCRGEASGVEQDIVGSRFILHEAHLGGGAPDQVRTGGQRVTVDLSGGERDLGKVGAGIGMVPIMCIEHRTLGKRL